MICEGGPIANVELLPVDVLLAADPAARRASVVYAQGFRFLEIDFIVSKVAQVSAEFTVQHSEHVRMFQTNGACCTLGPRELLTTRRILREFEASTETVEDSPREMSGCAAMIT